MSRIIYICHDASYCKLFVFFWMFILNETVLFHNTMDSFLFKYFFKHQKILFAPAFPQYLEVEKILG